MQQQQDKMLSCDDISNSSNPWTGNIPANHVLIISFSIILNMYMYCKNTKSIQFLWRIQVKNDVFEEHNIETIEWIDLCYTQSYLKAWVEGFIELSFSCNIISRSFQGHFSSFFHMYSNSRQVCSEPNNLTSIYV